MIALARLAQSIRIIKIIQTQFGLDLAEVFRMGKGRGIRPYPGDGSDNFLVLLKEVFLLMGLLPASHGAKRE